ncbi:MAG: hypothetical protein ABUL44_02565 [Flavobacterium sp.]
MPFLRIPKSSLPGLTAIANFDSAQISVFTKFLSSAPVGIEMNEIVSFLGKTFALPVKVPEDIVQTLISFRVLLDSPNVSFEHLSDQLVSSYRESTHEDAKNLKQNLLAIFENFKTLKLTLKADTLLSNDSAIYSESKIVTDIRIIFNDDLKESARNAMIVHGLNIEFYSSHEARNFHVSMTSIDLKNLQDVIERAIEKEKIISKDYSEDFKFIPSINK